MKEKDRDGSELGFGFEELVILLPLAVPVLVELKQILESFLDYLSTTKKVKILLEKDNKKLEIDTANGKIPDIKDLEKFFN
ncbi:MAG: hypothetical protein BWY15_01550 [Firmicutes bacterium ADurb.Bin193]|nr:MAG: hypothetical protein BWY15_01550 [Firmicutes bacterium ADurb.Bin193]